MDYKVPIILFLLSVLATLVADKYDDAPIFCALWTCPEENK